MLSTSTTSAAGLPRSLRRSTTTWTGTPRVPAPCAACNGSATNTFATFQAGCGEAHEFFTSGSLSLSSGVPQAGSPVLGAGANLRPLCTGNLWALCFDIRGALRPFRMRLDAVRFQRETAAITARAIGRVRLGSPRGAVEQVYGRRVTHRSGRQLLGFLKLRGRELRHIVGMVGCLTCAMPAGKLPPWRR